MKTLKLKIKNSDDIKDTIQPYLYQYTGLFHKLYKHNHSSIELKTKLLSKFDLLDVSIYESCKINVTTKIKQQQTLENNNLSLISDIENKLIDLNKQKNTLDVNIKHTKKYSKRNKLKRQIYRLNQKLSKLKRSLKTDITFGSRSLLRKISYQNNLKNNNSELYNSDVLDNSLQEYRNNRLLPFYIVGRASEGGNRKFKFDFVNEFIIFKPDRSTKIEIKYYAHKNYKNELLKIQELIDNKQIPITVTLSQGYICLSYDESLLRQNKVIETSSNISNNKIKKERYLSIDLNPFEIGYCIVEKDETKTDGYKVQYKELVCLKKLSKKLNKSSSDKSQKKQNNKRKFEICQISKRIFNIAKLFGVNCVIVEDLEFKSTDTGNKVTNKQVNNVWHRELTINQITKRCNESGIEFRTINPAYSSIIGNLVYDDYDCIAASLELARRGINKYLKGNKLYPEVSRIRLDKLLLKLKLKNKLRVSYVLNVKSSSQKVDFTSVCKDVSKMKSWKEIYGLLSSSGLRYRNKDRYCRKTDLFLSESDMKSHKSKVALLQYNYDLNIDMCENVY